MKEYTKLIMGLVSGFSLMLLNNDIAHDSLNKILTGFDPTNLDTIPLFLGQKISQMIVLLSFIGIFIIIISSLLILKKVIQS